MISSARMSDNIGVDMNNIGLGPFNVNNNTMTLQSPACHVPDGTESNSYDQDLTE